MSDYNYQPPLSEKSFSACVEELRQRGFKVDIHGVDGTSEGVVAQVKSAFGEIDRTVVQYQVDTDRFESYYQEAGYQQHWPDYYPGVVEMPLAHFVALDLLRPAAGDYFLDVASEHSPLADITRKRCKATAHSVDIHYPKGIHGNRIGADACNLPLNDHSVSQVAITDAIQHFEGDGDVLLIRELSRVLVKGGAFCVVPLYMSSVASIQTDPRMAVNCDVTFDSGAVVCCAEGWGNRHGRFYTPGTLSQRLMDTFENQFDFEVFELVNAAQIDPGVWARFALRGIRR